MCIGCVYALAVCWFVDVSAVAAEEDVICDVEDGDEERMRSESPPQPATAEEEEDPGTSSTLPKTKITDAL